MLDYKTLIWKCPICGEELIYAYSVWEGAVKQRRGIAESMLERLMVKHMQVHEPIREA